MAPKAAIAKSEHATIAREIKERRTPVPLALLKRTIEKHQKAIIGRSLLVRGGLKTALGEPKEGHGRQAGRVAKEQAKLVTVPLVARKKK